MNKFDNDFDGRMPLVLNDFRFIDAIYKYGLNAIMQGLSPQTNCILAGCEVSGVVYSDGIAWINNEIFEIKGTTVGGGVRLKLIEADLPDGRKKYGDGIFRETHKHRYLQVVADSTPDTLADFPNKTLDDVLHSNLIGTPYTDGVAKNSGGKLITEAINTAFNKNFGLGADEVAKGNHQHEDMYWKKTEIPAAEMLQAINIAKLTRQENFLLETL